MKLLLDTHVLLWWRLDSSRLRRTARQRIATADVVWVSAASGWEAAIKQGLGRLRLADSLTWMVEDSGFDELPVTLRHTEQFASLPPHHADPFDRMLIAHARVEGATIMTRDSQFEHYDVPVAPRLNSELTCVEYRSSPRVRAPAFAKATARPRRSSRVEQARAEARKKALPAGESWPTLSFPASCDDIAVRVASTAFFVLR